MLLRVRLLLKLKLLLLLMSVRLVSELTVIAFYTLASVVDLWHSADCHHQQLQRYDSGSGSPAAVAADVDDIQQTNPLQLTSYKTWRVIYSALA